MTDNEIKAVRKIMSTDLSKSYQKLEETQSNIYKLSGMTLDDILRHLAKGDVFVSSDLINRQQAEIEEKQKLIDRLHEVNEQLYEEMSERQKKKFV